MTTKLDSFKKTFVAGALILSQSAFLLPPVLAQDSSVKIAGQSVFSISTGAGSMSAAERAEKIQNNLDNALVAAKDLTPTAVNISYVKGTPIVTLGGYQVVTVDGATAKAAGTSPALLAQRWADGIRNALRDQASIASYVAQLSGSYSSSAPAAVNSPSPAQDQPAMAYSNQGQAQYQNAQYQSPGPSGYGAQTQPQYGGGGGSGYRQGRVVYAPAGLTMPLSLQTSISTQVAKPGDLIEATVSESVNLGDATIPAGSVVVGTVTDALAGRRMSRSGSLSIKFNRLRTPDGIETPISAHLVGGIAKYKEVGSDQSDTVRGEGGMAKIGQTAIRGAAGAGLGAALGTAVGAIAARSGRGVGRGAWGGAAIGGGLGMGDMLLRKGRDVIIPSGTRMQLQLDAPASIAGTGSAAAMPYSGNL